MRRIILAILALALCGHADAQQVFRPGHAPGWRPGLKFSSAAPAPTFSTARGSFIGQDTYIGTATAAAIGATNGKKLTTAFWILGDNSGTNPASSLLNGGIIENLPTTHCEVTAGTSPGLCLSIDNSAQFAQFNYNNSVGVTNSTDSLKIQGTGSGAFTSGPWNQFIVTMDSLNGVCAVVKDGVNVIGTLYTCPSNIATGGVIPDLNNSAGLYFMNANNANLTAASFAEMWVAEESLVCTGVGAPTTMGTTAVTCAGANTVPPEMIQKFRDSATGKPIFLGANGNGPTGRQPEVFLTGDGSAMATNLGTTSAGCCVAGISSPTGSGGIYSVKYGPTLPAYGPGGMISGRPTMRWSQSANSSGGTAFSTSPNRGNYTIPTGDLLILVVSLTDNSGSVDHDIQCPSTTAAGTTFTRVKATVDLQGSANSVVCYGKAAAGEVGPFPVSWTTANTRSTGWTLMDYSQVNSTTPVGVHDFAVSVVSATITTPVHTTTAANSTLVSIFTNWEAGRSGTLLSTPAGTEIRSYSTQGTKPEIFIVDESVATSGSATTRTTTETPANLGGIGFTIEVIAP